MTVLAPARAFYSGYRSSMVRRVHIMREDGRWAGGQGLCGIAGRATAKSPVVVLDPMPDTPPAGLTWCPSCMGHLAERAGMLPAWGEVLAGLSVRSTEVQF